MGARTAAEDGRMKHQDGGRRSDEPPLAPESATLRSGLETARNALRAAGIADSRIEAEVLTRFVLGWERDRFLTEVYAAGETRLAPRAFERLRSLVSRRLGGEPLAYIVGTREFYGLTLRVDERALIPRQETELLVEIALERLAGARRASVVRPLVIDVGTGSGALALAIAANARAIRVVASDVSGDALALARRNAESLGLTNRVEFVRCDLLTALRGRAADLIVSNPPYIPSGDMAGLQAEIKREPRIALDGGADGLDAFSRLARQAARRLAPGGALIAELMPGQMDAAERVAAERIPSARRMSRREDLFGDDRALVVETG